MAKFLVTGGAGFIGSLLSSRLLHSGHEVAALDVFRPYAFPIGPKIRKTDRIYRDGLKHSVNIFELDLLDRPNLLRVLEEFRPDCIIHLAANPIVSSAELDLVHCRGDIVDSTRTLLDAVRMAGHVRKFVHVSSSMVYGDFEDGQASEQAAADPVNVYGRLKLESEQCVMAVLAGSDTRWSIVRPMAVYGPGDFYPRVIPLLCSQALAGHPLTIRASADMRIDFSHIDDIVDGLVRVSTNPASDGEIFNISCGEARSLLELVDILRRHFPGLRCEISADRSVRRPVRGALDIGKARRMLGYRPGISLEEGVAGVLRHMQGDDYVAEAQQLRRYAP